jgi:hypothetical protein
MQSSLVSPFFIDYNDSESLNFGTYSRYLHLNIGKGATFLKQAPGTSYIINDTNAEVIRFYQNLGSQQLHSYIENIALNWELLKEFSEFSSKEIYISYQDFEDNIITLDDIQFMVRAIVLMNTDIEKFAPLFSMSFSISQDLFINSLIKSVVDQISKTKGSLKRTDQNKLLESFSNKMETGFKTGFFNHFQNMINLQNTNMVDCIDTNKQLAIWHFICQTSKGNKVSYDNNGNLKNQYGGEGANKTNLMIPLMQIKHAANEIASQHNQYYNLPYSGFLNEVTPKNGDLILADFRTINQIKSEAHELKLHTVIANLMSQLNQYSCKWVILFEDNAKLKVPEFIDTATIKILKTYKHEFAVLSNI